MLFDVKGRGGYNILGFFFYWGINIVLLLEKIKACLVELVVVRVR